MKILFLTIGQMNSLKEKSVHTDIVLALRDIGHEVCVCSTRESRLNLPTECVMNEGVKMVHLKTGNLTKCSFILKGINTLRIQWQFIRAIKKYLRNDEFDLVIYNTPPISLANVVKYCKKKYGCHSYLMLKDIFPQNAVDIGLMATGGIMGIMYRIFRRMEMNLYKQSDRIGCMNQCNVNYLLEHNPYIDIANVEIFPNAVGRIIPALAADIIVNSNDDKVDGQISYRHTVMIIPAEKDTDILTKLGIDNSKLTFIYGGNLGKPQGLEFLAQALVATMDCKCNFVIIGSGQGKEQLYRDLTDIANVYTFDCLPHDEYTRLCASCDVGMIALDYRFTIPNLPSRMLTYMENSMPILACTDRCCEMKELLEDDAKCGKWCYSNDVGAFKEQVEWFIANRELAVTMGARGYDYLVANYTVDKCTDCLESFMVDKSRQMH